MRQENVDKIMEGVVFTPTDHSQLNGGQHTNGPVRGCKAEHPDLGVSIFFDGHRTFSDNRDTARFLFEIAVRIIGKE